MPSGKHWFQFLYINIAFAIIIAGIFISIQIYEVYENWPEHRCKPTVLPLGDMDNFTYCIQSIFKDMIGYHLEPLTFITSSIGTM